MVYKNKLSPIAVAMRHKGNAFFTTFIHHPISKCFWQMLNYFVNILIYKWIPFIPYVSHSTATDLSLQNAFLKSWKSHSQWWQMRLFLTESGRQIMLKSTWMLNFLCYEGIKGQTCNRKPDWITSSLCTKHVTKMNWTCNLCGIYKFKFR